MKRKPFTPDLIVFLLIVFSAAVVYHALLIPGEAPYSKHSDIMPQGIATKTVLRDALTKDGHLPLWRSDQLSGGVALTHPQALYIYPFHFLYWVMDPVAAIGPTFFLHLLIAAFGCAFMGKAMRFSTPAKLFMGIAGLVSFKLLLAVYAGWQPILPALSLLPWFIGAVICYSRKPTLIHGLLVTGVFGLCLHAGAMQYFFYTVMAMTPYVIDIAIFRRTSLPKGHSTKLLVGLLLFGVLGLGLAAYLWLPVLYEINFLSRSDKTYSFFVSGHALSLKHLLTFLHPHALGSVLEGTYPGTELWEDVGYFGIIPLIFALSGIVVAVREKAHTIRILAGVMLCTSLLAFDTPLLRLFYEYLPGYDLFRCPSRMLFITTYLGILLAGYGVQRTSDWLLRTKPPHAVRLFHALLMIAMVAEGRIYAAQYIRTAARSTLLPSLPFLEPIRTDNRRPRVAVLGRSTFNPGWAAPNGIQLISGNDPYMLKHYRELFLFLAHDAFESQPQSTWLDLKAVARPDLLDVLNVGYLISPAPLGAARGVVGFLFRA